MRTISNLFILVILLMSCEQKNKIDNGIVKSSNLRIIKINEPYNNVLQIDSIFESIEAIPLETKDNCLISNIAKVRLHNDKLYVLNGLDQLLVFNKDGFFEREISHKGKGPHEFLESRDFDIDQDGNIFLLDFRKIHQFDSTGSFIKTIEFQPILENDIFLNPMYFTLNQKNGFYIYTGSIGVHNNMKHKGLFEMYEIDNNGFLKKGYFPLTHKSQFFANQLSKYGNSYNLSPRFGSDTIFCISNLGVSAKYILDYGKKFFKGKVPNEFDNLTEFKKTIDQNYVNTIGNIVETDEWIHFVFRYKNKMYNGYYSKLLDKSFVSSIFPLPPNRIIPWKIFASNNRGEMITLIEPYSLIEDINNMTSFNENDKKIRDVIGKTKSGDNPVLLICKMKFYDK